MLLPLPRAPVIRPTSRKSRQAAPGLACVRVTHYHMRAYSAVWRAGESIDAQLAVRGLAWLLLHSRSLLGRPVGMRAGGCTGARSHGAGSAPTVAPAAVLADGHAADLGYTLWPHTFTNSSGTWNSIAETSFPLY